MTEPNLTPAESTEPIKKLDNQQVHILDRLQSIVKESAETTTAHGLPNIARTQNRILQVFWLICFLGSSAYCIYTIVAVVQDYLSYPVVSNMNIVNELPTEFPTIIFCNLNPIYTDEPGVLQYIDNEVLSQSTFNVSDDLTATEYSRYRAESIKIVGYRFYPDYKTSLAWTPLDRMLISCTFAGSQCNASHFEEVYVYDYVSCYRFNTNGDKFTYRRGFDNGLQLELYIGNGGSPDNSKYLSNRGIRYMITNRTLNNLNIYDLGYDAPTGKVTNVEIKKKFYSKLGPPYSDCLSDLSPQSSGQTELMQIIFQELNQSKYNQIFCQNLCFQNQLLKYCNCYTWRYPYSNNTIAMYNLSEPRCIPENFGCMFNVLKDLSKNLDVCRDQCPVECDWYDYETFVSTSDYMSHWYWDYQQAYATKFGGSTTEREKLLRKLSQGTFEQARNSTLKIIFYMNQLGYTSTTESPFYSVSSLLATIGGNLGLFIGISFLSMIELVELAYRLIECIAFQAYAKRKASRKIRESGK